MRAHNSGNLRVAGQPAEADAFLIAVPTPFHQGKHAEYDGHAYKLADMGAVISAAESIVPFIRKGNLVLLESTSPPRTTVDLLAPILKRSGLEPGRDFHLAYSPERVLPGQILRELIDNARVVGGVTPESAHAAASLYALFVKGDIIETDSTTAELVKLMENSYRDTNIAIANEFSADLPQSSASTSGKPSRLPTAAAASGSSNRGRESADIASASIRGSSWSRRPNSPA